MKLKYILTSIVVFFLGIIVSKASVFETPSDFTSDIYVIGGSKFSNNIIVNAENLDLAKENNSKILDLINIGNENIYYYSSLFDTWYLVDSNEYKTLNEEQTTDLEENLYIFYTNNIEKKLTYEFEGENIEVLTNRVSFKDNIFTIPATILEFSFTTNNQKVEIKTKTYNETYSYGDFYKSFIINYYNEDGEFINKAWTDSEGLAPLKELYKEQRADYKLEYVNNLGQIINLNSPINENLEIYQRWLPTGHLEASDSIFENNTLTYNGLLNYNSTVKANEMKVLIYAPKDYNTASTIIHYQNKDINFDNTKVYDSVKNAYYVEMPIYFNSKDSVETINITWDNNITTNYEVKLSDQAQMEYVVKYDTEGVIEEEIVLEGNKITKNDPTKTGYAFAGWYLDGELFEKETLITKNIVLTARFKKIPTIPKELNYTRDLIYGIEKEFSFVIDSGDFTDVLLSGAVLNSTGTEVTSKMDNFEMFINGEWVDCSTHNITLTKGQNIVKYRIKNSDVSLTKIYLEFKVFSNAELLVSTKEYANMFTNAAAAMEIDGRYYKESALSGTGSKFLLSSPEHEAILRKDVTLSRTFVTMSSKNKNYVINLNGHTLSAAKGKDLFKITGINTSLTIKNGNIKMTGNGAIIVGKASLTPTNTTLNISEDATIISEKYGIVVVGNSSTVNFKGKIVLSGPGYGISETAGNVKNNGTLINIYESANIEVLTGAGLYLPVDGTVNIYGGKINAHTGIAIKSGKLNIYDGVINATGENADLHATGNGGLLTGDVIYAEVNDSYPKNMQINIEGGTFTSANANILRVYKSNSTDDVIVSGLYTTPNIDPSDSNIIVYTK